MLFFQVHLSAMVITKMVPLLKNRRRQTVLEACMIFKENSCSGGNSKLCYSSNNIQRRSNSQKLRYWALRKVPDKVLTVKVCFNNCGLKSVSDLSWDLNSRRNKQYTYWILIVRWKKVVSVCVSFCLSVWVSVYWFVSVFVSLRERPHYTWWWSVFLYKYL